MKKILITCLSFSLLFGGFSKLHAQENSEHKNSPQCQSAIHKKDKTKEILKDPRVIQTENAIFIPNDLLENEQLIPNNIIYPKFKGAIRTLAAIVNIALSSCGAVQFVSGFNPCEWLRDKLKSGVPTQTSKYKVYTRQVTKKDPNCMPPHSYQCNMSYTVYEYEPA